MVSAELILSLGKGTDELPSQGPFQNFFSTALKTKHDLDSLWTDPVCGNDMVSVPCSPYSPAACTHSSFMHLSTFSFFPLDSIIIYCHANLHLHARPFSVLLVQPPSLGGCRQTVLSKPSFAGGSNDPVCKLQHHP